MVDGEGERVAVEGEKKRREGGSRWGWRDENRIGSRRRVMSDRDQSRVLAPSSGRSYT